MFARLKFVLLSLQKQLSNIHVKDITESSQSWSFVHNWQGDNYVYPYLQRSENSRLILGYFSSERTLAYRVV